MKLFLAIWIALFCTSISQAQELTPGITNMAGFDGIQDGSVVTMSIGEPAIITLSNPNAILTQGFLQPEILPCVDVEFSYFPNPATSQITIEAFGCETKIESMEILNLWGQIVQTITPRKDNTVVLDGLSQAVYLIKIYLSSGISKTIKVVKVAP